MNTFQEFENSELAQMMLGLTQVTMKAVAQSLIENAGNEARQAIQELGADLSRKIFEARFGSELCSVMEVGKAKTIKRIQETNTQANFFFSMALDVLKKMDASQIKAIALKGELQ